MRDKRRKWQALSLPSASLVFSWGSSVVGKFLLSGSHLSISSCGGKKSRKMELKCFSYALINEICMRIAFKDLVLAWNDFCCTFQKHAFQNRLFTARSGLVCVRECEIGCMPQSYKVQLWNFQPRSTTSLIVNEISGGVLIVFDGEMMGWWNKDKGINKRMERSGGESRDEGQEENLGLTGSERQKGK